MAYNQIIPQGTDRPKDSQPQILANFQGIKTLVDIDHVTFDLADQGKHAKITLPVQIAGPLLAADNGFYNVLDFGGTNINQTFMHNQKFGGTMDVPMAASVLSNAAPVMGMNGWTYLPSGIRMRWDTQAVVAGLQTITLPALPGFVALTTIFSVNITPVGAGLSVPLIAITNNTQFTVNSSGAGSIRILTIGN